MTTADRLTLDAIRLQLQAGLLVRNGSVSDACRLLRIAAQLLAEAGRRENAHALREHMLRLLRTEAQS